MIFSFKIYLRRRDHLFWKGPWFPSQNSCASGEKKKKDKKTWEIMQCTKTPHTLLQYLHLETVLLWKDLPLDFNFYNLCTKYIAKKGDIRDSRDFAFPADETSLPWSKSIREQAPAPLWISRCWEEKAGTALHCSAVVWGVWAGSAQSCLQCCSHLPPLPSHQVWARTLLGSEECAKYFPDLFSCVHR